MSLALGLGVAASGQPGVAIGSKVADAQVDATKVQEIYSALTAGLARGGVTLISPSDACETQDSICHRKAAAEAGLQFVLEVEVGWDDPDITLVLNLFDARGDLLSSRSSICELCGSSELTEWAEGEAAALAPRIARLGPRPGRLTIDGSPRGASVVIDGRTVGRLPYEGEWPAGVHEVLITAKGHLPEDRRVEIDSGTDETLEVRLAETPSVVRMTPQTRRALGWSLLGLGLAGVATGATLWAIDGNEHGGSCTAANLDINGACPNVYTTRTAGIATLASGVALTISGGVLVGLSRPAGAGRLQATLGPSSIGFRGRF